MPSDKVFLLVDEIVSSRILIISSGAEISNNLKALVCHEGFDNVDVVKNLTTALSLVNSCEKGNKNHVDLIIFRPDVVDGLAESIWEAKEAFETNNVPLIVVGEWQNSEEFLDVIETGGVDFVAEPVNHYSFIARVKTLLRLRHANSNLCRHQEDLRFMANELEQKNQRLNSILEDIQFDLRVAGELQRSFLPDKKIKFDAVDIAWFYQPCATIGGDLINVIPVTRRHIAVFLLDVAGHGVSAALLAFAIHRYLSSEGNKSILRRGNGKVRPPAEVLRLLNRDFSLESEWFKYFTITFGVLDSATGVFRYCRAGQTPLVLLRSDGECEILKEGSPPIGICVGAVFKEFQLVIRPGDRLILYSDGIIEARRSEDEFYGDDRFIEAMKKLHNQSLELAIDKFVSSFYNWMGSSIPRDDIALLALEVKKVEDDSR